MAKKLSSVLGIDIGSQTIKIAEVKLQGGRPTVTALGMAQTPEGAVDHIGIHDPNGVSDVLKSLCASAGATTNEVVASIAGQGSVLVRTLEVPAMNDSELKQHMDWEITRNIPFAESTVVSDFKAFSPEAGNMQNMDVVMAISPQSAIDTLVGLLKKSGRKPAAIDVEALGIARALDSSYHNDLMGKSVCVVDIGHKTTSINVYKDGKLMMPRQVPIGGEMMTRAISENMGVTTEEAANIKALQAEIPSDVGGGAAYNPFDTGATTQAFAPYNPFAEPDESISEPVSEARPEEPEPMPVPAQNPQAPNQAYQAMAGILDEFVAEVRRSIDYFRSKGGDVDMIMVCGGGSKLKGLSVFLESALGLPTELLDPLKGLNVNVKKYDNYRDEDRHDFTVAVGNGLHICF